MSKVKQKKNYKRKSVISQTLIILIGVFIFLLLVFLLVKAKIISNNNVQDESVQNETNQNDGSSEVLGIKNTVTVSSYVFNEQNQMETAGYFTNLTGSSQNQKYVSLVLEEDKILSFKGTTLNKFVISTYDGETFETFTGTYSEDGQNLVLNFLTTTYNNYEIPSTIKIYVDGNYAILDGNKLMIDNRIASVYSNDTLSSLPSIFGDNTVNFASLLIVRDNLSEFGVANQNKFMITGYNENTWDYYFGEAYENQGSLNLKMKGYGYNTINDIMPKEATLKVTSEGIMVDSNLLK